MRTIQITCACSYMDKSVLFYIRRWLEELCEFLAKPSAEEFSDMAMCLNLVVYKITGCNRLWKIAYRAQDKGLARYRAHGCCRAKHNACNSA